MSKLSTSSAVAKYHIVIENKSFEIIFDKKDSDALVRFDDQEIPFALNNGNEAHLVTAKGMDKELQFRVDNSGNNTTVLFGSKECRVQVLSDRERIIESYRSSSKSETAVSSIVSPLPGLVTSIAAKEGDSLKKGDSILIIEAMKMENEIKAPHDCVLAKLNIAVGETIEKGGTLATFE